MDLTDGTSGTTARGAQPLAAESRVRGHTMLLDLHVSAGVEDTIELTTEEGQRT
jgi:hypothetical protein